VIRNLILTPLARSLRRWARAAGGGSEAPVEYALFLLGWVLWPIDGLLRIPALIRHVTTGLPEGVIPASGAVLIRAGSDAEAARRRASDLLAAADAIVRPHGLGVRIVALCAQRLPDLPLPEGGPEALIGPFFRWASARSAGSPPLTVYFVEDLGSLAGCAVPGADWIVVDLNTDGTTLVHEIGHLADLWRHTEDPGNVMTDRPGGTHDGLTRLQAGFIRTCRFVTVPGPSRKRDGW
jgi:hypothetical protein